MTSAKIDGAGHRLMTMKPGMIFDNLLPGEDIDMIESNRPNTMLEQFRNSQLRAVAAGTCTSFRALQRLQWNIFCTASRIGRAICALCCIEGAFYRKVCKAYMAEIYTDCASY